MPYIVKTELFFIGLFKPMNLKRTGYSYLRALMYSGARSPTVF
jgi:hypothetical protein